jgi:hypothetical protein
MSSITVSKESVPPVMAIPPRRDEFTLNPFGCVAHLFTVVLGV